LRPGSGRPWLGVKAIIDIDFGGSVSMFPQIIQKRLSFHQLLPLF